MMLLVSPKNKQEAIEAIAGGAHIIDVKNPSEGSLGANFPWIIKEIRELTPPTIDVSATIGDLDYKPGTAAQAALGAAFAGANYVKLGLFGKMTEDQAIDLVDKVVSAVNLFSPEIKVAVAGYADAHRIGAIEPMLVPTITSKAKAHVAMIDTAIKDGKSTFDFLKETQLKIFIENAHRLGLIAALAGNLQKNDLIRVWKLKVDIAGVRTAVCKNGRNGKVDRELVRELTNYIQQIGK
ncbi:MAG: (5-formylfuran-3-yl)methyl phosphate synthase [Euryarchaeota archaeon]|nr:(5-formylfuran-3-yl)methyl phosphate synthase [Euryarchaeota archaeon]